MKNGFKLIFHFIAILNLYLNFYISKMRRNKLCGNLLYTGIFIQLIYQNVNFMVSVKLKIYLEKFYLLYVQNKPFIVSFIRLTINML